jgi:copper chaperone
MKTKLLEIQGMSCGHCVMTIKKELSKLNGIVIEDVQIGKAHIQVDEVNITEAQLKEQIEHAGYSLVSIR